MASKPKEHWARVPRKVVLHRMATSDCLDGRLFWAMILWSWCGPEVSDLVVLKDAKGYVRRDRDGNPFPATLKDLSELLGLAPGMKGHVSEAAQRLEVKNSVRFDGRKMYPEREPAPPEPLPKVALSGNFHIGSRVVLSGNLPSDPVARSEAIRWLEQASQSYYSDLKAVRSKHNALLDQAIPTLGLVFKKKKSKEVKKKTPPSGGRAEKVDPLVDSPPPEPPPARPPRADSPQKVLPHHLELRKYLDSRPIGTALDDDMWLQIREQIPDEATLQQFKTEADQVQNPRKWAVYLSIAKQVRERGPTPKAATAAGAGENGSPAKGKKRKWAEGLWDRTDL